jgi:hypothetical protein
VQLGQARCADRLGRVERDDEIDLGIVPGNRRQRRRERKMRRGGQRRSFGARPGTDRRLDAVRSAELRLDASPRRSRRLLAQQYIFVLVAESVFEPAAQAPLLEPVERGDSADDNRTDDQQTDLQIAHAKRSWFRPAMPQPLR